MVGMFEWVVELIDVVEGGWFISRGEDEKLNWISTAGDHRKITNQYSHNNRVLVS